MAQIRVEQGDITTYSVDAIVNAANTTLLGGGGVDGAIHRAAGPGLLQECRKIGGCPTGEARISQGYGLSARHVIHTAGPVWNDGRRGEEALLKNCYENSLRLALQNGIHSLAFPSISTGAYRFPIDRAARIAVETVRTFADTYPGIKEIIFVCFSGRDREIYEELLKEKGDAA